METGSFSIIRRTGQGRGAPGSFRSENVKRNLRGILQSFRAGRTLEQIGKTFGFSISTAFRLRELILQRERICCPRSDKFRERKYRSVAAAILILFAGSVVAQTPTPTPPTIVFAWYANSPANEITNYKLYEQVGTNYTLLATIPPNVVTWTIPAPTDNKSHLYVLTAVNATKETPKSNQAAWPPDPQPPRGFSVR